MHFAHGHVLGIVLLATMAMTKILPSTFSFKHSQPREMFEDWLRRFNSKGLASYPDFEYRLKVFADNLNFIRNNNAGNSSVQLGLNQFADLTYEEFLSKYTGRRIELTRRRNKKEVDLEYMKVWEGARKVDWVDKGVVLPPENQLGCGCSYAFAAASGAQAAYAIFVQKPISKFSKQVLVNCGESMSYDIKGCEGGSSVAALEFYRDFGIYSAIDIPYKGVESNCSMNYPQIARLRDFKIIGPTVKDLLEAIEVAPVVVSMEIVASYQFYQNGVIDVKAPCGFYINHSALAVGYDLDAETPYIVFQNSFGEDWGEKGYFRYAIGKGSSNGMCGIANEFNAQPVF